MLRSNKLFASAVLATGLFLTAPAAASADTFVNDDGGDDMNPCTMAQPCLTVQAGVDAAGAGETVHVDGGEYADTTLDGGKNLIEDNFNTLDGDSQALINGGGADAITVQIAETAGTIQGFNLQSTATALSLAGPATSVTGNTFDSTADNSTGISVNNVAAGASTIGPGNVFTDDGNDMERRFGVSVSAGSPTITGSTFTALSDPIFGAGSGTISGNEFTLTHFASGGVGGRAITVLGHTPTIVGNHIHMEDPETGAIGIDVTELGGSTGATLRRNRILDHLIGVTVFDTTSAVTLHSDVIRNPVGSVGLSLQDTMPLGATESDVTATNVTIGGHISDIDVTDALLTFNSSIVEDPINDIGATAACMISFSRGPLMTPGGNGCDDFQTTAAPMFAPDGYHLLAGSPMIDMGDPAAPVAPSDLDVDGENRAVDENCDGVVRRNIGADEIPTTCPGPTPTPTPTTPLVVPTPTAAPTGQRAAALKKCKKKRSKAKRRKCRKRARQLPV